MSTNEVERTEILAGDIHELGVPLNEAIRDVDLILEMSVRIEGGDAYIARNVVERSLLERIRTYLITVGQNSLPNYHPIETGAPNSHRMNRGDPRANVAGSFHQFSFFPWNQDMFNLFEIARPVFQMKNVLSGLDLDRFLGIEPEEGVTARLAFQFYPRGIGGLNRHADPVDRHQLTVPTMLMCEKGVDFQSGGVFVEKAGGERVYLDDVMTWGDVLFFNARMTHGVETIDPGTEPNWLAFEGRWIMLFAVNKLQQVADISDSIDLDRP